MNDWFRLSQDILVMAVIAIPPFLYLHEFINYILYKSADKKDHRKLFYLLQFFIYVVYWAGTVLLSNMVPAATIIFLIVYIRKMPENDYRILRPDFSQMTWSFSLGKFIKVSAFGILIKYVITIINAAVIIILTLLKVELVNQEIVNIFLESNIYQSVYYFILTVIGAPVVEEFVFRYWFFDRIFKRKVGIRLAAVLSSILFMGAHFNIQGAAAFFLVGIINCYLFEKFGYWSAVANHFIFNFTSILMLVALRL